MAYKHGAYGEIAQGADRSTVKTKRAPLYVGTAPVHTVPGGASNLNKPVVITSFSDAVKRFGYSDDWKTYTLCEAMYAHFEKVGIGPIILVNVMGVELYEGTDGTASVTPVKGRAAVSNAESIILDSVTITGKTLGADYTLAYDYRRRQINISLVESETLGDAPLSITYKTLDASELDIDDVIGASDGEGLNTGLYAVLDMYQKTGIVPSMLMCPGFSEYPAVHAKMAALSRRVNQHWDMRFFTDIPILGAGGTQMTLAGASAWQQANGYTNEHEKVFFPMMEYTDGRVYHLSVLACANMQSLEAATNGIPYQSVSNTDLAGAKNLYFGEGGSDLCIDDQMINEKLCKFGITSAAFVGGRWVIWGPHTAAYNYETAEDGDANVFDTTIAMLFYVTNDFQHRRPMDVDKPAPLNRLKQIVGEEQARLDALVATGALVMGSVELDASAQAQSDMANGDFRFLFDIKTTPLAKSLTAIVSPAAYTSGRGD